MAGLSFAVISDIHVYSSGKVPQDFTTVVAELAVAQPRFVVVSGDATVGNPGDGVSDEKVGAWWIAFKAALAPLRQAGIPVLVIAGNHDYYTDAHRRGYLAAWADLTPDVESSGLGPLRGQPPLSYALRVDDLFLLFLHTVDQKLAPETAAYAEAALASEEATTAALRLAIGHVPLVSMMGKTSETYRDQLGSLLVRGGVSAFFSGHEHLVWDQALSFDGGTLRQIHVGTASGTYHYPLNAATFSAHCSEGRGTLPYSGQAFALLPGSKQQADKVTLAWVDVDGGSYDVRHLCLRDGHLSRFGE